jgi:uncharacterized protein
MKPHAAGPEQACGGAHASAGAPRYRSPRKFFLLVFAFSVPLWLIGAVIDVQFLPGLPLSALGVFCPLLAALVLVHAECKTAGVVALLKRSFDFKRIRRKRWYVPIVLLAPGVSVLVYVLMRAMNMPVPAPQLAVLATLFMFLGFFAGALCEELGWSGYAIDPMQARWNALRASVLLGLVTALWHIVPLLQAHRPTAWIAWWCLYAVAARVLIVWLYNNTGKSVFAAALFHTLLNLSWMLFPIHGSFFDMRLAGLVMAFVAAMVVVVWRRR